MPLVEKYESTSAVYNDPVLAQHLAAALERVLGKSNVVVEPPIMGSEDYSVFIEQGIPSLFFKLGAADPQKLAQASASHKQPLLPTLLYLLPSWIRLCTPASRLR
jgi:metal-dependent amidase/aminoacylase/carboxypeptidase family protein